MYVCMYVCMYMYIIPYNCYRRTCLHSMRADIYAFLNKDVQEGIVTLQFGSLTACAFLPVLNSRTTSSRTSLQSLALDGRP